MGKILFFLLNYLFFLTNVFLFLIYQDVLKNFLWIVKLYVHLDRPR